MSTIIKGIVLVVMLAALLWVGTCVYSNFIAKPDTGQLDMPCKEDAAYSVYIENTGNLLLTSDYEQHGDLAGSRIFILHGFWEMRGQKFKFLSGDIILDESIFGEITVKKRTKD